MSRDYVASSQGKPAPAPEAERCCDAPWAHSHDADGAIAPPIADAPAPAPEPSGRMSAMDFERLEYGLDAPPLMRLLYAEARRARASEVENQKTANFWMNLFDSVKDYDALCAERDALAERVKTLERAIRDAPHATKCSYSYCGQEPCNCWKAAALAGKP